MPTRRQVLRGLAGFTLALPTLPSLLPRSARAAGPVPRRFIAMASEHGGVWQDQLYPGDGALSDTRSYAGHTLRRGDLPLAIDGATARISPVLSAPASLLTPALAAKMNVMRGFDITFYIAHHRGGHLGNYADNDGNGTDGTDMQALASPTIDQVLAWSDRFYPDTSGILERSLVMGDHGMSAGWSNPRDQSGTVQRMPNESDSRALFDRIFRDGTEPARKPVVDLVIEDYRRMRQGDTRLSTGDRRRLDEHMERLYELERKLDADVSCDDVSPPMQSSMDWIHQRDFHQDPAAQVRAWQLLNDVIVAAFACDTCRIATLRPHLTFTDYAGDWHQEIAHQANRVTWSSPPATTGPHPHGRLAEGHQRFFEGIFVDLIAKLDAVGMSDGSTLLDASLVQWTHESGPNTHDPIEMPVITAGGAAGALRTGSYCDFRNLGSVASRASSENRINSHTGLIYNQWLGHVLQIMGLPRTDFERDGWGGYGAVKLSTETWYAGYDKYDANVLGVMGDRVPFV